MKIDEIELVGDQSFSIDTVTYYLSMASPLGSFEEFTMYYLEQKNHRIIILIDDDRKIAAFAGFEVWNNGKVWQARNAETFTPYKGRKLIARIYKHVKEVLHKSIQSDKEESYGGKKLWTKTLPMLGLKPMIFDRETDRIIDPEKSDIDVYKVFHNGDPEQWRYTWIIERFDNYPSQNLLIEGGLLMPLTGLWKK